MKKNIDPQTAKLFEAVKTAYFRECSGIVRDNKELQPLTVDIMNQLLNGCNVNNMTIADAVAMTPAAALPVADDADTLQVVELPTVTVTAPRTPSGQKTGLTPSGQKTASQKNE